MASTLAIHEIGHALVALHHGFRVRRLSIRSTNRIRAGKCVLAWSAIVSPSPAVLLAALDVAQAGELAEEIVEGERGYSLSNRRVMKALCTRLARLSSVSATRMLVSSAERVRVVLDDDRLRRGLVAAAGVLDIRNRLTGRELIEGLRSQTWGERLRSHHTSPGW